MMSYNELTDKYLETRLELIKSTQRRSSFSYLINIVITLSLLISIFNSLLSWDLDFATKSKFSKNEVIKFLEKSMIENWVDNRRISIDLLGIQLSVSDLTIVASICLFLLSFWLLLNLKRENSTIGTLLHETQHEDKETKKFIYNYIAANQIFSSSFDKLSIIKSLKEPLQTTEQRGSRISIISVFLIYIPSFAIFSSVAADWSAMFIDAPFREGPSGLWDIVFGRCCCNYPPSCKLVLSFLGTTSFGFLFGLFTFYLNNLARINEKSTRNILIEYESSIES